MTDARPTPQDPLIEHYREHGSGEPPVHLDTFILAAAQREVPTPKPNLWQRWVRACQQPRWQVAFASLVGVALMLALVQRSPEQAPGYDFAPAPKASAPMAKKESEPAAARSLAAPAQRASFSAEMADEAKVSKRAAAPMKSLDEQLREVLRLQKTGQTQAADKLLADLHKRFPDENLTTRLKALQEN